MTLLDAAAWALAVPPALATAIVIVEVALGLLPARASPPPAERAVRTVILMPAHNEERIVAATLERLPLLPDGMSVLVVADNCSDSTARIARGSGAEVIERSDPARRGKGFALAFGRDHLRRDPPECVIVLDADCETGADSLRALAAAACRRDAPVQAAYLIRPERGGSPLVEVSTFAFAVKNLIRQRGLARLGAPALLTGTGMAFPWRIFAEAPLASGNIVEDLELGLDLLGQGERPGFLASAEVWSAPSGGAGTISQRSRWEGGFLATARRRALPLLGTGLARLSWPRLWMGLHLLAPPLVLLLFAGLAAAALLALLAALGASPAPLFLLLALLGLLALALLGAWARLGRAYLSPGAALRLPLYALWKVPLYARMLVRGGPKDWVRTDRDGRL